MIIQWRQLTCKQTNQNKLRLSNNLSVVSSFLWLIIFFVSILRWNELSPFFFVRQFANKRSLFQSQRLLFLPRLGDKTRKCSKNESTLQSCNDGHDFGLRNEETYKCNNIQPYLKDIDLKLQYHSFWNKLVLE